MNLKDQINELDEILQAMEETITEYRRKLAKEDNTNTNELRGKISALQMGIDELKKFLN